MQYTQNRKKRSINHDTELSRKPTHTCEQGAWQRHAGGRAHCGQQPPFSYASSPWAMGAVKGEAGHRLSHSRQGRTQRQDGHPQSPLPGRHSPLRSTALPRRARQKEERLVGEAGTPVFLTSSHPCLHDDATVRWWTWGLTSSRWGFGWILEFWNYLTSRPIKSKILSFYYQRKKQHKNQPTKESQPNKQKI